jgi:hypothetical protein
MVIKRSHLEGQRQRILKVPFKRHMNVQEERTSAEHFDWIDHRGNAEVEKDTKENVIAHCFHSLRLTIRIGCTE